MALNDCDAIDEGRCPICSHLPPSERPAFRATLDTIPLSGPVCDACEIAFWRGLGLPVADTDGELERDNSKLH